MTKSLNKSWMFLLVSLLLLVLAACSNTTPTEETEQKPDKTETGETEEGTSEEGTSGGISGDLEIQYFVGGYGDAWWKAVIADFKTAYPDVNVIEHAGPNINTEMNTRWISNDPPDVVYIDGAGSSETKMIS